MRRHVSETVKLSDGTIIPKDTLIGVSSHSMWDPEKYPDPHKFDGYRFLRMAEDAEKEREAHFVSISPDHLAFGYGKHACPGRFFVANEVKIALSHILLKYDIKLAPGADPKPRMSGWTFQAHDTGIMIRRRKEEIML